jgi:hypothetical protein
VPIRQYLSDDRSFEPHELEVMNEALAAALAKLGLKDRDDPLVEIVARRIVFAGLAGERDPIKLTEIGASGRD